VKTFHECFGPTIKFCLKMKVIILILSTTDGEAGQVKS